MKRLAVMRHAQAGMASVDIQRQLTEHGLEQAAESVSKLKEVFSPQLVLVSPAVRTRMTVEQVASVYGWTGDYCLFDDSIYNAAVKSLLRLVDKLSDDYSDVLLVAHNPGVSNLVSSLTGGFGVSFSPGTFALLEIATDSWSEVNYSNVSVKLSYSPL